jgi:putative ABC transport system permease protein
VMRILRDGGRTGTGMRLSLFTTIMVVIEVALAVVLLSGAGVATRTALLTLSRDSGVSAQGFMTGRVMLPEASYNDAARADFWPRAVLELASQPGVLAATAATVMPGAGTGNSTVAIEGATYPDRASFPVAQDVAITAGFFAAFDSRLLAGRDFNSGDRMGSLPVVIVNQAFSTAHFPQGDAVGKRIRINAEEPDAPWLTIIGVAPNINHDDSWDRLGVFEPVVYSTLTQLPIRFVTIAVRVAGDPRRYADLLRQTIGRMESESPVYFLGTLQERQDKPRGGMKIIAGMFTVFAVVAILLAAVGLYGVLAFTIGQRNREIGIRRAMGARNGQVLQAVLRAALVQLAIGLAIGALLAPLLTAALPNFVTGGYPHDVWVYAIVFALVALCALLASWVPALRALGVQPAVALRYE